MKFYSTRRHSPTVGLKEAVINAMPPDNGLYMPERIPVLPEAFFKVLPDLSLTEIARQVSRAFLADDLSDADICWVVDQAITFDTPLVCLRDGLFSLELFHGPTLAFKDIGARFMARLLGKLQERREKTIDILVATSGDTGSAVAQGFYDVPGVHVTILYPAGKVSAVQEQQIATLDKNITSLEVAGTFDDCQRLVKTAFSDAELTRRLRISSANSINFARLLPQTFYYFHAAGQVSKKGGQPFVISVPSGNFGNLTAGLIARKMGLPVQRFIAAVNVNTTFPAFLKSGVFTPVPSLQTISNAMDVGNPSNLGRITDLFNGDLDALRRVVFSRSFSDAETRTALRSLRKDYGYMADPHGAVGFLGVQAYRRAYKDDVAAIFLETAHPAKFGAIVSKETGTPVTLPQRLQVFMGRKKNSLPISKNFDEFKQFLLDRT